MHAARLTSTSLRPDVTGVAISVPKKLTRHSEIRTTMNVYGDVVTDEMMQAQRKVAGFILNSTQTARRLSY